MPATFAIRSAAITASVSRRAGGLLETVSALSRSLIEHSCEASVFGALDMYSAHDLHQWDGVPLLAQPILGPRAFGYRPDLHGALAAYDPDLVHVHGLWMYQSVAALRWSRRTKRPLLISPHGMLDSWALRNSAWKKKIAGFLYENRHLQRAACIRALCNSEANSIRALGLANPIAVIPNGVVPPDLDLDLPKPDWEARLPAGAKVLLFLGRIHPKKGTAGLIDAWGGLRAGGAKHADEWHLVVAGWADGPHEAELLRKVADLNIADNVHFVGPQFDASRAATLRRADAFVLPSFSEGLPSVVLEAWSNRLPVIMTPQCNLPEGFAAGAAIRVNPTVDSLMEALGKLFDTPGWELRQMGDNGRRLVEENFNWNSIGRDMVSVYDWLLGRGPLPGHVRLD